MAQTAEDVHNRMRDTFGPSKYDHRTEAHVDAVREYLRALDRDDLEMAALESVAECVMITRALMEIASREISECDRVIAVSSAFIQ